MAEWPEGARQALNLRIHALLHALDTWCVTNLPNLWQDTETVTAALKALRVEIERSSDHIAGTPGLPDALFPLVALAARIDAWDPHAVYAKEAPSLRRITEHALRVKQYLQTGPGPRFDASLADSPTVQPA